MTFFSATVMKIKGFKFSKLLEVGMIYTLETRALLLVVKYIPVSKYWKIKGVTKKKKKKNQENLDKNLQN